MNDITCDGISGIISRSTCADTDWLTTNLSDSISINSLNNGGIKPKIKKFHIDGNSNSNDYHYVKGCDTQTLIDELVSRGYVVTMLSTQYQKKEKIKYDFFDFLI